MIDKIRRKIEPIRRFLNKSSIYTDIGAKQIAVKFIDDLEYFFYQLSEERCEWKGNDELFSTSCGDEFSFAYPPPYKDAVNFCPYCSKKIDWRE